MTVLAVVGMAREAKIAAGPGIRILVGGGRSDQLSRALSEAMTADITALISFGVAGALDANLAVGDVVIGTQVGADSTDQAWASALAAALPSARQGGVFGSDTMVLRAEDKARLHRQTGCVIVDMESHLTARAAASKGLPLAILRVVSDTAGTSLPTAVMNGLKPDGSPNLAGVLMGLAQRPGELPGLIQLGRDSEQALKTLAQVRASIGSAFARL